MGKSGAHLIISISSELAADLSFERMKTGQHGDFLPNGADGSESINIVIMKINVEELLLFLALRKGRERTLNGLTVKLINED